MDVKTRFIIAFAVLNFYCLFLFVPSFFGTSGKSLLAGKTCRYDSYNVTGTLLTAEREWRQFREQYRQKLDVIRKKEINPRRILILIVVEDKTDMAIYERAISTVDCYRRIHDYSFKIANDKDYKVECPQYDRFFRRHCITALILSDYDYLLFLDADVGVVNPERRIEEFLDERFDVILYDRFHNPEVAAGSYIVRNTQYAKNFLNGFANYEKKLINGTLHGTDNGALHAYLGDVVIGEKNLGYKMCLSVWHSSQGYEDLFAFEACVRALLGRREDFGRIKIANRSNGWMRDSWLTNSLWNPKTDFILHGWKKHQYINYTLCDLPIDISIKLPASNIFPLAKEIQRDLCIPGNTTWSYDPNLITTEGHLRGEYGKMMRIVENNNIALLARVQEVLAVSYFMWE